MFVLRLLGNPIIAGEDGTPVTGAATQRHRVALLALLAIAGDRGQSREKLLGYLWPNRDAESARLLLNQAVYNLRKALGDDALLSVADDLRLNSQQVDVDAVQFEAALERGDHEAAIVLYKGPFLDGLFLSDAVEFERWTERERARLADRYAGALESLAEAAEAAHDPERAVRRWKARAAHDPHDSRVAVRLMEALAATGNRAGALQYADIHTRLLQDEFGAQPPAEVIALAARLRSQPAAAPVARVATAAPASAPVPSPQPSASTPASAAAPARRRWRVWYGVASTGFAIVFFTAFWASRSHTNAVPSAAAERSIAVLPLASESVDPRDAAWADGMTDALIAILAKNSGLRVIASTSVFAYRNRQSDVRSIGESLGVANVLEGGVQKDGNRLRVRVRLLDARDGSTRWSETYDRELRDAFAVQDEVGNTVARELGLRLGVSSAPARRREPTKNIAAYESFIRGSDRTLLRSDSAARLGLEYFEQAIALDSTYAEAWAGLARMRGRLASTAPARDRLRLQQSAIDAVQRALSLDDSLAEAHATLGALRTGMLDFAAAEEQLARALELDPGRALTHQWMVTLDLWEDRPAEALAHARRALELDPLSPDARADLARALLGNDRCDEALAELKPLFALHPPMLRVAPIAAQCYARKNMWQDAIAVMRPQTERDAASLGLFGYLLARGGKRDEALRLRAMLLERQRREGGHAFDIAFVSAGLGNLDSTFQWLNRALDDQSYLAGPGGTALFISPLTSDLRGDPRFDRFRERIGLQNR